MDYNLNKKKSNKVLYISLISVLCVFAALIAATSANNRKGDSAPAKFPAADNQITTDTTAERPASNPAETTRSVVPELKQTTEAEVEIDAASTVDASSPEVDPAADNSAAVAALPEEPPLPEFVSPVNGEISKDFTDSILVYSLTMNDYRAHMGVDYAAPVGAPVYATADGTVSEVWEDPLMGVCISIAHSGNAESVYKNLSADSLSSDEIKKGSAITSGQIIASVGESSIIEQADTPHIHYELKINNTQVNPNEYIKGTMGYEG